MTGEEANRFARAVVESHRAARPIAPDTETMPHCPVCKRRMDFVRPVAGGSRVFRCAVCKQEHIL